MPTTLFRLMHRGWQRLLLGTDFVCRGPGAYHLRRAVLAALDDRQTLEVIGYSRESFCDGDHLILLLCRMPHGFRSVRRFVAKGTILEQPTDPQRSEGLIAAVREIGFGSYFQTFPLTRAHAAYKVCFGTPRSCRVKVLHDRSRRHSRMLVDCLESFFAVEGLAVD
jgi:hypothetical protein